MEGRDDEGYSCATDASGNVYLAGETQSTTGLPQQALTKLQWRRVYDAFLVKFNSSGVRQWGTYYGGTGMIMAIPAPLMRVETFT